MNTDQTLPHESRMRMRAGVISLGAALALLAAKYFAYSLTGSSAILSDALESIVNVVAAVFALSSLAFSGRPADRNHPYGHGKIEFFSAAFEGGVIAFAALMILYEAATSLILGSKIQALSRGVLIILAAGAGNALLGWFLIRTGERYQSLTLVADGHHVLADFWTSLGVAVGLGLVMLTGYSLFDPLIAGVVGVHLAWTGFRLVREAAGGLLDEEDTDLLEKLVTAFNARMVPGIIRVHYLRAIRAGRFRHVDAHLVVPEYWSVDRAHDLADTFEERVIKLMPFDGEIVFHTDPCHRAYCASCDVEECSVRAAPFVRRPPITVEEAVESDVSTAARWGVNLRAKPWLSGR